MDGVFETDEDVASAVEYLRTSTHPIKTIYLSRQGDVDVQPLFDALGRRPELRVVDYCDRYKDTAPPVAISLPQITELRLTHTTVSDIQIHALERLSLDLTATPPSLFDQVKTSKTLVLLKLHHYSDEILDVLAVNQSLLYFNVIIFPHSWFEAFQRFIPNIEAIVKTHPNLEELELGSSDAFLRETRYRRRLFFFAIGKGRVVRRFLDRDGDHAILRRVAECLYDASEPLVEGTHY